MNKIEKINNIAFTLLYVVMGISALIGAVFFGATHQLITVGICGLMIWSLRAEVRRENKKGFVKQFKMDEL